MREADSADIARDQANAEEGELQHDQQRPIRRSCKARDLHSAIDEAWSTRHLVASCPVPGTYLIHAPGQRPVEGVAVWRYSAGTWVCEVDGAQPCPHIQLAKQEYGE